MMGLGTLWQCFVELCLLSAKQLRMSGKSNGVHTMWTLIGPHCHLKGER